MSANTTPRKLTPQDFADKHKRIYEFLFTNPIGVLSSIGPNGDPHGAVIYFIVSKKFVIGFLTKSNTKKYDNLTHHSHVMLTVFEPFTQTTAQVTGVAKEITDGFTINEIAQRVLITSLRTSDAGMPPLSKLEAGGYVGFEISPVQVRMAVYDRPDSGEYTELFETIEKDELGQL